MPQSPTASTINAVHFRFAPMVGGGSRTHHPVADSDVLTPLPAADGWTSDRGELPLAGYLVQLANWMRDPLVPIPYIK